MWYPIITKEDLEKYYIFEKHSKYETLKNFNISERELYKHLHYYKIGKVLINKPSKEELEKHYLEDKLTHAEIAKLYHKSKECIRNWYREYKIKIPKELTQEIREKTNFIKYGTKTPLTNKECIKKSEQTSLIKYGVKKAADAPAIRAVAGKHIKESRIKNHTTNKELMANQSVYKDGLTRKEYFLKTRRKTLCTNHKTGKMTKDETLIYKLLKAKYNKSLYQYMSDEYPFLCDFYIPELNLYIEYQGYWSHGKNYKKILGPYDQTNEEHQKLLKMWKSKIKTENSSYIEAINTWTIRDPLKREIARKNKLNWIEFWNIDEFIDWYCIKIKETE